MDKAKTYNVANIRIEQEGGRCWLEIYLMLSDNSEHRKLQVGGFVIESPDQRVRYSITGQTNETSIITYVGGSEKHRYTRFSMLIEQKVYELLRKEALIRFLVEDLSEHEHIRHKEEFSIIDGSPQGIGKCIWIKE